jgi:hypothetical protein
MFDDHHHSSADDYTGPTEQNWDGPLADPIRVAYRDRLVFWTLLMYTGAEGMPEYSDHGNVRQNVMAKFLNVPQLPNPEFKSSEVIAALHVAFALQSSKVDVTAQDHQRVAAIENLTPADFACIARKIKFTPISPTMQESLEWLLLEMLQGNVRFKSQGRRSIGFHCMGEKP